MPDTMTPAGDNELCNALWIGGRLTELAGACLASFVEMGHAVRLYAYEPIDGIPRGVALADAADIVSLDRLEPFRAGRSYAAFSNLFRYELLAREAGIWIDCDLLSVRPLVAGRSHVFGYEAAGRINNAVLKLPADSPVLADLRAVFTAPRWKPPWNDWKRNVRDFVTQRRSGADYNAVVTGPRILSHVVEKQGLAERAEPIDVFYPVAVQATPNLLLPDFEIRSLITPRTLCIHLCTSYLADRWASDALPGSFLHAVLSGKWRAHLLEEQI